MLHLKASPSPHSLPLFYCLWNKGWTTSTISNNIINNIFEQIFTVQIWTQSQKPILYVSEPKTLHCTARGLFLFSLFQCLQSCVRVFTMCPYVLYVMNDLIRPCTSQQRGLGNIRPKLHTRALMVSLCFIYIQVHSVLPNAHTQTIHNMLNLISIRVDICMNVLLQANYKQTQLFASGLKKAQSFQKICQYISQYGEQSV